MMRMSRGLVSKFYEDRLKEWGIFNLEKINLNGLWHLKGYQRQEGQKRSRRSILCHSIDQDKQRSLLCHSRGQDKQFETISNKLYQSRFQVNVRPEFLTV